MLRNKVGALVVSVVAVGMMIPRTAGAVTQVCNEGTVNYANSIDTAQTPVTSAKACFDRVSNPVLTIVKTVDKPAPAIGETVTYTITVRYPKIADVASICGDDSIAKNIVITDVLPAGITYVANSITLNENGAGAAPVADAVAWNGGTNTVTVGAAAPLITNMNEGDGDAACAAGNTRVITFQATVN